MGRLNVFGTRRIININEIFGPNILSQQCAQGYFYYKSPV